jgi:hypothetical protein
MLTFPGRIRCVFGKVIGSGVLAAVMVVASTNFATCAFAESIPIDCASDWHGFCTVEASDPGTPDAPGQDSSGGTGSNEETPPDSGGTDGSGDDRSSEPSTAESPCGWHLYDPPPEPGSALWEGHSAADGHVEFEMCDDGRGVSAAGASIFRFVPNAAPAVEDRTASQASALGEAAAKAQKEIPAPVPDLHFGADPTQVAVKVPVGMCIDPPPAPASVSVTAGTVTVTATPVVESVTWDMGDPVDPTTSDGPPYDLIPPVTCTLEQMRQTSAQTAPGSYVWRSTPPCSYTYFWRSLPERTGGTGKWTVTATVNWRIEWTSTLPDAGTVDAPAVSSATTLHVGEWSTVLVAPR